jgi:hypothetical protein
MQEAERLANRYVDKKMKEEKKEKEEIKTMEEKQY